MSWDAACVEDSKMEDESAAAGWGAEEKDAPPSNDASPAADGWNNESSQKIEKRSEQKDEAVAAAWG